MTSEEYERLCELANAVERIATAVEKIVDVIAAPLDAPTLSCIHCGCDAHLPTRRCPECECEGQPGSCKRCCCKGR